MLNTQIQDTHVSRPPIGRAKTVQQLLSIDNAAHSYVAILTATEMLAFVGRLRCKPATRFDIQWFVHFALDSGQVSHFTVSRIGCTARLRVAAVMRHAPNIYLEGLAVECHAARFDCSSGHGVTSWSLTWH